MNCRGISLGSDDANAISRNMPCGGGWLSQCCKFIPMTVLCPIQKEKLLPTVLKAALVGVTEIPPSLEKCHEAFQRFAPGSQKLRTSEPVRDYLSR